MLVPLPKGSCDLVWTRRRACIAMDRSTGQCVRRTTASTNRPSSSRRTSQWLEWRRNSYRNSYPDIHASPNDGGADQDSQPGQSERIAILAARQRVAARRVAHAVTLQGIRL